jgi:hypothetical protein
LSINGDYDLPVKIYNPAFGVQGDKDNKLSLWRLNLSDYYSDDYSNTIKPGYNIFYFVPSTVATYNTNGLLYVRATVKISYKS